MPFRGTDITEYLRNGGDLEITARISSQESTRTTRLYNRVEGKLMLDEIEQIHIKICCANDAIEESRFCPAQ